MREQVITNAVIADPKSRYGNGPAATRHFIVQRLTGAINILFALFLVFIVVNIAGGDRDTVIGLLGNPIVGIPFALLFAIVCVHMRIGMREIIEDYIHDARTHRLSLALNSFFAIAVAVIGILSILKIVVWG